MKSLKDIILEKLKVTTNDTGLHICKVELDKFIPWIYGVAYYCVDDLIPNDLIEVDAPFKDTLRTDFNNDSEKLYKFFAKQVKENPIINVESIEDSPGVWRFEFTLDGITFKTHKKYKYSLDEWKKIYPYDSSLNFYVNESKIDEKLKVTNDVFRYEDGNELFANVIDALQVYPSYELDVKSLKLMGKYTHDYSNKIRSIDYIYYSDAPKSKNGWMIAILDNDVYIKIGDFKSFHSLVFSKNGESSEEVLNNILDLISNG